MDTVETVDSECSSFQAMGNDVPALCEFLDCIGMDCEDLLLSARVFAVGDLRTKALRQIITAASDGAVAAFYAEEYLAETGASAG